ncbi:MAG: hypothetical protein IT364_23410 [Candidatus Hydrogenedentes bacterium]|nr:hypothetical protein [Candidatus Hydrogenedentota bacterium]
MDTSPKRPPTNPPGFPIAISLLVLLAGAAMLLWGNATAFEGEMRVAVGSFGNVAVRPAVQVMAGAPRLAGPAMETMAGADLPLDQQSGGGDWIEPNRYYDAVPLPFAVSVVSAKELQPRTDHGRMDVSEGEAIAAYDSAVGTSIPLGSGTGKVVAVQPWSGIVTAAGNPPMAALAVAAREGETFRDFLLPAGSWVRVNDETGVFFAWVAGESDARLLLDKGQGEAPSARWGAVDRGETSWLRTFEPGSGLVLSDGTSITLLRRDAARAGDGERAPAIEVKIAGKMGVSRHRIPVNAIDPNVPIRYEDVSLMPVAVRVVSWEQNAALVQVSGYDMDPVERRLREGERLDMEPEGLLIRLDTALPHAVAVLPGSTSKLEAVVEFPERTVRLLEGRPAQVNGASLTFSAEMEPARIAYDLVLTEADGATQRRHLAPGEFLRLKGWLIRQKPSRATSTELADLAVTYVPAQYAKWGGDACLAFTLGTWGLLIVRRFRRLSDVKAR